MLGMTDESTTDAAPGGAVCPWCSAALPSEPTDHCPSCGASLAAGSDESLPGLTAIDAAAIVRSKQKTIRPRSRLLSWLSGDDPDEMYAKAEGTALQLPELDVRREMFRLELEAEVANLQAENDAILAEAAADGRPITLPPDLAEAQNTEVGDPTDVESVEAPAAADASAPADAPAAEVEAPPPA
jgi:hypothetical protein